ncbi:MAG: alpha/beta fold hydrolase [Proteobacteria bacterium]|nr:alpha/beta fold hydrolase [Pseudomonadota bacterium]
MSALPAALDLRWPNAAASVKVEAGGLTWHLQDFGSGPALLMLHGTGAASHSWRALAPLLAEHFRVLAPDLPGHGFSGSPATAEEFSIVGMGRAVHALLYKLAVDPVIAVGHSAGAAILVRMALDRLITPRALVSINGALLPMSGFPGWMFAPLARLMARSDFIPHWVARRARDRGVIERLIRNTGSRLDAEGIRCYQALAQRPRHVAAALQMMAQWDLHALAHDLPRLQVPLVLLASARDRTIPPEQSARVKSILPDAKTVSLGALGHLAHEEEPARTAEVILRTATQAAIGRG